VGEAIAEHIAGKPEDAGAEFIFFNWLLDQEVVTIPILSSLGPAAPQFDTQPRGRFLAALPDLRRHGFVFLRRGEQFAYDFWREILRSDLSIFLCPLQMIFGGQ